MNNNMTSDPLTPTNTQIAQSLEKIVSTRNITGWDCDMILEAVNRLKMSEKE